MLELVAQGKTAYQRWRKVVLQDLPFIVGRTSDDFAVGWDEKISRNHAALTLSDDRLTVEKLDGATNPIFFNGDEQQQEFFVKPGEHFVIGDTTFSLTNDSAFATLELPSPVSQRAFSPEFLRQVRYRDADHRIAVLNRLPEIISSSNNDDVLLGHMVNLLLAGITSSTAVAVCEQDEDGHPQVLKWDQRSPSGGDFKPCSRLINQAIERKESTLHMWQASEVGAADYTVDLFNDWAFVCPLGGPASRGLAIYVAGLNRGGGITQSDTDESDVQGDVKFAELVGATMANLRRVQQLERRQSTFRAFFSPVVMQAFVDQDPEEVLRPRECEISVLFCDLRGFSAKSEEMSDQLEELLDRVSQALGIMTQKVLDFGGVIGDFHGDSAMGFWGWPLEKQDAAANACEAALEIQKELANIAAQPQHLLHDFRMGIGVATGNAVAGKIGTSHQVKVTAFGPVVNLAARLEGISGRMKVPILIDGPTADSLAEFSAGDQSMQVRSLGNFRPYGLNVASRVFQLFCDQSAPGAEACENYATGLQRFESGDWQAATELLTKSAHCDNASAFLLDYIVGARKAGPGFDGSVKLGAK